MMITVKYPIHQFIERGRFRMKTYEVPLVPGPVSVPVKFREAYMTDFGSSDPGKGLFMNFEREPETSQRDTQRQQTVTHQSEKLC